MNELLIRNYTLKLNGKNKMSIESPENRENLSEYQREILESVGVESIKKLEDLLSDLEEGTEEYIYFKQVLEDLKQ